MAYSKPQHFVRLSNDTEMIKIASDKFKYTNKNHQKVSAKMYDYHCNIRLQVGNQTFRAHKDVLSEASDYFAAMFSHDMVEKEQDAIELHDISPEGFSAMMDYFYHGHVTLMSEIIEDILEAARFFHIEWLIQVCSDFLVRYLSLENYNFVLELADSFSLGDLHDEIFTFVSLNFFQLSKELQQISYEMLHNLLAENFFIEASESIIFRTVVRWLESDEERLCHKVNLLKLIHYPLLEEQDLDNLPDIVKNTPELTPLIEEAYEYQSCPPGQCLRRSGQTEVRGALDVLTLISPDEDAQIFQYKTANMNGFLQELVDISFMKSVFEFSKVVQLGNFLFVAGGYDRSNWWSSPAFYSYNPQNHSWVQLTSMLKPRVSFTLVADPSRGIYALAGIEHTSKEGHDLENILDSVELYDPIENVWSFAEPLPCGLFSCGAVMAENQQLYVCGGVSSDPEHDVPVNFLYTSQPDRRGWTELAPMLTCRQEHATVACKDSIYVFGGYTGGPNMMSFEDCLTCEVYNMETNQWSFICNIPPHLGHIFSPGLFFSDKVYLLCGSTTDAERHLIKYDPSSDSLSDPEDCGHCVKHLSTLKVAFPKFILQDPVPAE